MSSSTESVAHFVSKEYKYGFVTEIETEKIEKGINENVIRFLSAKKNEPQFLLDFRLKAYKYWLKLNEPNWADLNYPPINYQNII